jgi:hypothetical protein
MTILYWLKYSYFKTCITLLVKASLSFAGILILPDRPRNGKMKRL